MNTDNRTDSPSPVRSTVMHVIDSLDVSGGAEKQLIANLRSFDRTTLRHELVLVESASDARDDAIADLLQIETLVPRGRASRTQAISRLRNLVRDRRPDLIHATLPKAALSTRIVSRLEGIAAVESLVNISHEAIRTIDNPSVTTTKLRFHAVLDRLSMSSLAGFHAVSEAVADSWTDTVGLDRSRIEVIPRGVDLWDFDMITAERQQHRESVRREFGLPPGSVLVLSVGRVEPQKGHRYLVEAMSDLIRRRPEVRLLIVGRDGAASPVVRSTIEARKLRRHVMLTGARLDLPRLLAASDVFAFPSLFEGNGGNAMIEAMVAEVPIVTTGAPPMTDLIPDDCYGVLVPRQSPNEISKGILKLIENPDLGKQLAEAARLRAESLPTPSEIAKRYETWYTDLIRKAY